mgnify:CR=1 FL=1
MGQAYHEAHGTIAGNVLGLRDGIILCVASAGRTTPWLGRGRVDVMVAKLRVEVKSLSQI